MQVPASVARRLGWYVYLYVNPLDEKVFYVGKGKGARCLAYLDVGGRSDKARIIRDIRRAGKEPRIDILAHGLRDEQTAFRVEAAAIDLLRLDELANAVRGKHALKLGRATLQARLQHPHIVALLSAGEAAGVRCFTMPLVEGESLRSRLARHDELPVNPAVRLLPGIAAALA